MDDNFIDLGGDSLAATRIISRVIANFQIEIPLRSLFQSPTVAEMACVISQHEVNRLEQHDLTQLLDELESLEEEEASRLASKVTSKPAKK